MEISRTVILEEQGLRDGLQTIPQILTTEHKIELINKFVDAGLKRIQIASFVHPRLVPQMADAEAVCKQVNKRAGVLYSGLVLNQKGVERGIDAGLNHLACSISTSDTHSQKNARMTLSEARANFKSMVQMAKSNGLQVRGGLQCAFGCRYEGNIDRERVYDMVKSHLDEGIEEIALADSTGMANPDQMGEMMTRVVELAEGKPVILHLHNTESKGLANLYTALKAGVRIFDTAVGGLGGCPFIKSATGNIATEDSIHMLHQMGYETGIDVRKMINIANELSTFLNLEMAGSVHKLYANSEIQMN